MAMVPVFSVLVACMVQDVNGVRGPNESISMLETETLRKDKCSDFGAKEQGGDGQCKCPDERPVPSECWVISGQTFSLNVEDAWISSHCRCVEDKCPSFLAIAVAGSCQCPQERPLRNRECAARSDYTFFSLSTASPDCRCLEDKCESFGATDVDDGGGWCKCPKKHPKTTKQCGGESPFEASEASEGCRCVTEEGLAEAMRIPVSLSVLSFCSGLLEEKYRENPDVIVMKQAMRNTLNTLKKTSHVDVLTGTITEGEMVPTWAQEAARAQMKPVVEDASSAPKKTLWEAALDNILMNERAVVFRLMEEQSLGLAVDVVKKKIPFAEACSERVVRTYKAEMLGCCARSCGWNGQVCTLWPFFSREDKVNWEVECCAEMALLMDSSRERMCDSLLSNSKLEYRREYDLKEQGGTDSDRVLLGQSPLPDRKVIGQSQLQFWAKKGAREAKLGKEEGAREGDKTTMESLLQHAKNDGTCDLLKKENKACPNEVVNAYIKACQHSWMVAENQREAGNFGQQILDFGECSVKKPENFAVPEECERLAKNSFGDIFLHYFEYRKDEEKPIACFTLSKLQCKAKVGWWNSIQLKSVEDLMMNGQNIKDYKDLIYVKVNAD